MVSKELQTSLIVGQEVWLLKDRSNKSKVTIVSQTSRKLFTEVTVDNKHTWNVMTYRLTII